MSATKFTKTIDSDASERFASPRPSGSLQESISSLTSDVDSGDSSSSEEANMEELVFVRALAAFKLYEQVATANVIYRRRNRLNEVPHAHALQSRLNAHLTKLETAIEQNEKFTSAIYHSGMQMLSPDALQLLHSNDPSGQPSNLDNHKVVSTLRQFAREWSSLGAPEREQSYGKIIDELRARFPDPTVRNGLRVVVPGCGLGRLPFDLACAGFNAQGNEFSCAMLFGSNMVLNDSCKAESWIIHPYIHTFSHHASAADQLLAIQVPDVWPNEVLSIPEAGQLSMTAGSFEESYGSGQLLADVVATAFFLDTAANIHETLQSVANTVPINGLWINFGPLLWHYEEVDTDDHGRTGGLELTAEDLLALLPSYGWKIERLETGIPATYCTSPHSLGKFIYDCMFWVARRVAPVAH